jgi:PsbP-like protein
LSTKNDRPIWPVFIVLITFFAILAVVIGSPESIVLSFSKYFGLKSESSNPMTSSPTTISMGFYNNTNCGITMQLPVNWSGTKYADEKLDKIENVLLSASPSPESLSTFELSLLDISNPSVYPKKSLDEVVDFETDYIITGPSDTIETIKNTHVSGHPARMVVYSEDFQTLHNKIMKLWVVASGKAYQITYDAPREQYAQHLPTVQEIIKSINLDNTIGCKVGKI